MGPDATRVQKKQRDRSHKEVTPNGGPTERTQVGMSRETVRELISKGVAEKVAELELEKAGGRPKLLSLTEGPLAPEI